MSASNNKQESYQHPNPLYRVIDGVLYERFVTKDLLQELKDLPVQAGDVFINTYQKSGTTWMSEIVWQVLLDGKIDERPIAIRTEYLEHAKRNHNLKTREELYNKYLQFPFPRVFKFHLPHYRMPLGNGAAKPKIIYVIRNPKDVAVSYYWHYKGWQCYEFNRSWDEFFEMFIEGNVVTGSWFDYVLGWWAHRDDPNILILKYEDMKKNLHGAVQEVAKFLGKDLCPEVIEKIAEQTTFTSMSSGKGRFYDDLNDIELKKKLGRIPGIKFLRKGEVGDWRNYFTEEQNRRFDELYERRMAGSGLELEFG